MKQTENKRPSNNPHGRPTIDKSEKKILIGVYLKKSTIKNFGGNIKLRKKIKELLGVTE